LDSDVYDTVLEETGHSDAFQRRIGQVRLTGSIALVSGSLLGGWIASIASARLTYFLTVPFAALAAVAYLRFREPQLHNVGDRTSLRRHLVLTYRSPAETMPAISAGGAQGDHDPFAGEPVDGLDAVAGGPHVLGDGEIEALRDDRVDEMPGQVPVAFRDRDVPGAVALVRRGVGVCCPDRERGKELE
jgi:hypothetical protein